MPNGEVGGGSQNSYSSMGTIFQNNPVPETGSTQKIKFTKSKRDKLTRRHESECWNAGTPVEWTDEHLLDRAHAISPDEPGYPRITSAPCKDEYGTVEILATLDEQRKPTEFHPLIMFYNEVLARLFTDPTVDGAKMLDGLKTPESAIKLWRYLEKKYFGGETKGGGNAKATDPVKETNGVLK